MNCSMARGAGDVARAERPSCCLVAWHGISRGCGGGAWRIGAREGASLVLARQANGGEQRRHSVRRHTTNLLHVFVVHHTMSVVASPMAQCAARPFASRGAFKGKASRARVAAKRTGAFSVSVRLRHTHGGGDRTRRNFFRCVARRRAQTHACLSFRP